MLLAYVCSFLGALQVPAFIAALAYSIIGFAYNWNTVESDDDSMSETKNQSFIEKCAHFWDSPIIKSTPNRPLQSAIAPSSVQPISSPITSDCEPTALLKNKLELNFKAAEQAKYIESDNQSTKPQSQSAIYFKALFFACLVTILYKQLFVLALSLIPVLIYVLNKVIVTFGIKEYLLNIFNEAFLLVQVIQSNEFSHLISTLNFCFVIPGLDCG